MGKWGETSSGAAMQNMASWKRDLPCWILQHFQGWDQHLWQQELSKQSTLMNNTTEIHRFNVKMAINWVLSIPLRPNPAKRSCQRCPASATRALHTGLRDAMKKPDIARRKIIGMKLGTKAKTITATASWVVSDWPEKMCKTMGT